MKVLFVCTGNTCRSPMAEGYLKSLNLPFVEVISRGLAADGSPVSQKAHKVMTEKGITLKEKSDVVSIEDIKAADKIIVMSSSHREVLRPYAKQKVQILGDGIFDPFGLGLEEYRLCRDEIILALDGMVQKGEFCEITVTPPEREDIAKIAKLEEICFSEPWSADAILQSLSHGTRFFAAKKKGELLGYVGISVVLDEGYITNVAVFPEYRSSGVGRALINAVFKMAEENGLSFVSLEVRQSNAAAIALYEKTGFVTEGKRKAFYRHPTEDALIMTKRFEKNENSKH